MVFEALFCMSGQVELGPLRRPRQGKPDWLLLVTRFQLAAMLRAGQSEIGHPETAIVKCFLTNPT
jgi:hypothetical protein